MAETEERISKIKAAELFDKDLLKDTEPGSLQSLKSIHEYLFGEIYNFGGKIRNYNISKGNFRFVPVVYLEEASGKIEKMPQGNFDEIIEKYVEMNVSHPFMEGNGRSMRIWLDEILKKEISKVIDWSLVDKNEYLLAMARSPVRDLELKYIFKQALSDDTESREIYLRGIDCSYYFEGYDRYKNRRFISILIPIAGSYVRY